MSTIIDGLSYLGVPTWREVTGAELNDDKYGIDTLTRQYDVRPDSIAAFKLAFPKGFQDTTYFWLYLTEIKIADVNGPLPRATVMFRGALLETDQQNPKLPRNVMITGGLAQQQVSLQSLREALGTGTKQVTYYAPWTEYRYLTTTDPKLLTPAFPGQLNVQKPQAVVKTSSGAFGDIKIMNDTVYGPGSRPPKPTGIFVGLLRINNSKFDYTQVGTIYQVIERNELLVIDWVVAELNFLDGTVW